MSEHELESEYYFSLLEELAELLITKKPAKARDIIIDYIDEYWDTEEVVRVKKCLDKLDFPKDGIRYERRTF